MRKVTLAMLMLLAQAQIALGQLSADDAMARLRERQASRGTTQPASRPAAAATRPASMKEAHRIVFLIDDRGALWPVFDAMREELTLAVNNLRDDQLFTIIVFRPQGQAASIFSEDPIRADKAARANAAKFIASIQEQVATNSIPGIAKAVAFEPDLLCLVASDEFPETDGVRRAFRPFYGRLNIILFTAFVPHPKEFLRTLAAEHGGTAMDQRGNVLEPPKPPPVAEKRKPESRPSIFERQD